MNKLSETELFKVVNESYKGSLVKTLQEAFGNIDKYTVEYDHYDFVVKAMRSYKYPLSKLIILSAVAKTIKPVVLSDPKNQKDNQIYLPPAIPTFGSDAGCFVDISPRASYKRDRLGAIETLKIKEIELYAYLQMAYLDLMFKKKGSVIDGSGVIIKNVAVAYSRLFSRCIDKTFPIASGIERFNVSIFLSAVFCLKTFFGHSIENAKNIVFSSGICNRAEIESDCAVLREEKLEFDGLSSFLEIYSYEFSDYIREGHLTTRTMVNMFIKMYGPNSYFALEHATSFINMILAIPIGLYNDKFISKTIKAQTDKITAALVTTFANSQ